MEHPKSPINCFLPIIVGKTGLLDSFPWENLQRLPDIVSIETANRAARILRSLHVNDAQIARMEKKSIRSIVSAVLAYQGVQLAKLPDEATAIRECASRILQAVRAQISAMASKVSNFISACPSGHEVVGLALTPQ